MKTKPKQKSNPKEQNPAQHKTVVHDLQDLQHEELSGSDKEDQSTAYSDTDEDEKEASGDGKIGRSKKDILNR